MSADISAGVCAYMYADISADISVDISADSKLVCSSLGRTCVKTGNVIPPYI